MVRGQIAGRHHFFFPSEYKRDSVRKYIAK